MTIYRRQFLGAAALGVVGGVVGYAASPAYAFSVPKLSRRLLDRAKASLDAHGARIVHRDIIAIADYVAPSREERFYLVNLTDGRVQMMHVAHGRGSDPANTGFVQRFSNLPGSNASSEGSFLTGNTYIGKHGHSRRLIGLDPGNSLAEPRAIVIHGADYVSAAMARETGRVGRSQGCFTVAQSEIENLLARLGPGRLLFAGKL